MSRLTTHTQTDAYASPWPLRRRLALLVWQLCWTLGCSWTPKPLNAWRLLILRLFGAQIQGRPFVHGRARITQPWNLTLHHRACLGDGAIAYTLGPIELGVGCTIAQEAYLCTGTHDFASPALELRTGPIRIGAHAFIGARAFVLPGLEIGEGAVIGANAVVTRDVPRLSIMAGNPARPVGQRPASALPLPTKE
jgi:putative colanic acid biosynthesis acetyltransferase WcaF